MAVVGGVLIGPAVLAAIAGTTRLTFMAVPNFMTASLRLGLGSPCDRVFVSCQRWLVASRPARKR